MTDDEIARAFTDITPQDLLRATTAHEVTTDPEVVGRGFPAFTAGEQDRTVVAFRQMSFPDDGDWFVTTAVLENATERREFNPEPDETTGAYLRRLRREAAEMDARRFAVSMLTSAAYTPKGEQLPDVDAASGDSVRAAVARGELSRHLVAYTEQRNAKAAVVMWAVSDDNELGPMVTAEVNSPLFASVLRSVEG